MKPFRLNLFFAALAAGLLEFSASAQFTVTNHLSAAPPQAMPRRTSIILVVAEGLGWGDLSCYGQKKFQTPNLDKLAAEGMRFTSYAAGSAASSPARAALMTGRDAAHLRQRADVDIPLAAGDTTVAQVLQRAGYLTCLIGEWNLGDENSAGAPWKKGFGEFAGYLDANDAKNFYADYMWRLDPGYTYDESYNDPINGHWRLWNKTNGSPVPGKEMIYVNTRGKEQYIPDLLAKAALNFIENNPPDQFNHYRPFFLEVNFKIPGDGKGAVLTDAPFSEEKWPQPEKNKAAVIARLDGYVGQLQDKLQKLGVTNDVAIFFTSDTGPRKAEGIDPKFFNSAGPSGGSCVPMIVRWPDRIPVGRVSDFKWSAKDFLPTVTDIALAKAPANLDGNSVLPVLSGQVGK
jgi:arylsulfatase A-like enzyme